MTEQIYAKNLATHPGDQFNEDHSWFDSVDPVVACALIEAAQETDPVTHPIQKMASFFKAMRAFCDRLRSNGHEAL